MVAIPTIHIFAIANKIMAMIHLLGPPRPTPPQCERELGMQSYAIPDSSVTASSMLWALAKAGNGRLHLISTPGENDGGWIAEPNKEENSWFQVDFGRWTKVTGISTQGRQGFFLDWVTKYSVSYSYDGIFFLDYKENGDVAKVLYKIAFTALVQMT